MEKGGMEKNNKRNHDEKDTMSVKQCKPGIIIPKIEYISHLLLNST